MRIPERMVLLACLAVSSGGWVCTQSDPCPDKLTCSTKVGDVCCPPGKPYLCGGSCSSASCSGAVACQYPGENDTGQCQLASLSATIDAVTCGNRTTGPSGDTYMLDASGTMSGCGDATLRIAASEAQVSGATIDCGTWTSASVDACRPISGPTTTTWTLHALLEVPMGASIGTTVAVDLDALNQPVLAANALHCQ